MFAVSQPPHVDINEILIRPTAQPIVTVTSPKASATEERLAWQAKHFVNRRAAYLHFVALLLLFALVAGAGTALSPCVLPVLPGAAVGRRDRRAAAAAGRS